MSKLIKVSTSRKYWVLRKGDIYFNTFSDEFYKTDNVKSLSDFHLAHPFPTFESAKSFKNGYAKNHYIGKYQIVEVSVSEKTQYALETCDV